MKRKIFCSAVVVVLIIVIVGCFIYEHPTSFEEQETVADNFKVNTILLKSTISQKDVISVPVKITNFKDAQNFKLWFDNLEGFATLDESEFSLDSWGEKETEVVFKGSIEDGPGIYSGFLVVETSSEIKHIPVIVSIQSNKVAFATNLIITSGYKELIPGDDLFTEIRVFNLIDSKTHPVKITSLIKNFGGETILLESEQRIVGVETSVSKTIALPKDLPIGNYVFGVIVEFEGAKSSSSFLFEVVKEKKSLSFFKGSDSFTIVFAVAVVFILLIIIILVVYLMMERNKLFLQLKKQHDKELNFLILELEGRKKRQLSAVKKHKEKKLIKDKFKLIRKKVLSKVKKKQKRQKIIFKNLRKHKRRSEMQRKLAQWKKQGINISELDSLTKGVEEELKQSVKNWKDQGYHA